MSKLTLSFFGAPSFSARVLERVITEMKDVADVKSVFTQPDKKAGRKQILTPTPVKLLAQKYNLPVFTESDPLFISQQLKDIDLVLLYAYGTLLPAEVLKVPRWGFWNIHPSLLPKYRGTSPIVYSLLMGDKTTGVSLMEMDDRMDHGPILAQQKYDIKTSDTRENLENRLSDIGYELFKKSIHLLMYSKLQKQEQIHDNRTYTRLLSKQDGLVSFAIIQKIITKEKLSKNDLPPIINNYLMKYNPKNDQKTDEAYWNLYRGLSPWSGLWTVLPDNRKLKITGMEWKNNTLIITRVQLEGKKEVDFKTFNTAYAIF
jgi:methionyl-tRNA formyltransferase